VKKSLSNQRERLIRCSYLTITLAIKSTELLFRGGWLSSSGAHSLFVKQSGRAAEAARPWPLRTPKAHPAHPALHSLSALLLSANFSLIAKIRRSAFSSKAAISCRLRRAAFWARLRSMGGLRAAPSTNIRAAIRYCRSPRTNRCRSHYHAELRAGELRSRISDVRRQLLPAGARCVWWPDRESRKCLPPPASNQQPVAKLPLSLMVVAFTSNSHCDSSYAELP